jgi:hypothetical protein
MERVKMVGILVLAAAAEQQLTVLGTIYVQMELMWDSPEYK